VKWQEINTDVIQSSGVVLIFNLEMLGDLLEILF